MIEITRYALTRNDLMSLQTDERKLLLVLGHAHNELNCFTKLVQFASQTVSTVDFLQNAEVAQVMILVRTLIGKVFESLRLVGERVQSNHGLRNKLSLEITGRTKAAYEQIKGRIGKNSILADLRTNFAFHNPNGDELESSFEACLPDDNYDVLMTLSQTNSFYTFSETVIMNAIYRRANIGRDPQAVFAFIDDIVHIAIQLVEVLDAAINLILAETPLDNRISIYELEGLPKIRDVTLPFFVDDRPPLS